MQKFTFLFVVNKILNAHFMNGKAHYFTLPRFECVTKCQEQFYSLLPVFSRTCDPRADLYCEEVLSKHCRVEFAAVEQIGDGWIESSSFSFRERLSSRCFRASWVPVGSAKDSLCIWTRTASTTHRQVTSGTHSPMWVGSSKKVLGLCHCLQWTNQMDLVAVPKAASLLLYLRYFSFFFVLFYICSSLHLLQCLWASCLPYDEQQT